LLRSKGILFHNKTILLRSKGILLRSKAILFRNKSILFRSKDILFRSKSILLRNKSILFRNKSILLRNKIILFWKTTVFYASRNRLKALKPQSLWQFCTDFTIGYFGYSGLFLSRLSAASQCGDGYASPSGHLTIYGARSMRATIPIGRDRRHRAASGKKFGMRRRSIASPHCDEAQPRPAVQRDPETPELGHGEKARFLPQILIRNKLSSR